MLYFFEIKEKYYSNEEDLLNAALFGVRAKQRKDPNSDKKEICVIEHLLQKFQLSFIISTGASYRVTITNVSMIMLNSVNCSEVEYGVQYASNGKPLAD